jgi:hypothetical protein
MMTHASPNGDLFRKGSPACHAALEELRSVLLRVGFSVAKKSPLDSTLRVYSRKYGQYPLLNPRFEAVAPGRKSLECVWISVLSKGDEELDAYLRAYPSSDACTFVVDGITQGPYYYHGHFILPITLIRTDQTERVDFSALDGPLRGLLEFLHST